jgi:hypothetical protein
MTDWIKDLLPLYQVAIALNMSYIALDRFRYIKRIDKLFKSRIGSFQDILNANGDKRDTALSDAEETRKRLNIKLEWLYGRRRLIIKRFELYGALDSVISQILFFSLTLMFFSVSLMPYDLTCFIKTHISIRALMCSFYMVVICGILVPAFFIIYAKSKIISVNRKFDIIESKLRIEYGATPPNSKIEKFSKQIKSQKDE